MQEPKHICCAEDVARLARVELRSAPGAGEQEVFLVFALDAKHRPAGEPWIAAVGSVACVEVHPRDVFREAIRRNAVAVIACHNHPSGECEPSHEDTRLTSRLKQAGDLLGIPVLDHVVFSANGHVSLAGRGEI